MKNSYSGIFKGSALILLLLTILFLALPTSNDFKRSFVSDNNHIPVIPTPIVVNSPSPSPKYVVTFIKQPDVSKLYEEPIFVDVKIKNISAEPFITGLRINNCSFVDGNNITRQSATQIGGGVDFKKAILPGEERVLSNQQFTLDAGGMTGLNAKGQNCEYDLQGNYVCKMVKGLKLVSCDTYITGVEDTEQTQVSFD